MGEQLESIVQREVATSRLACDCVLGAKGVGG